MAAQKKPAAKKTAGTAMAKWDEELAKRAQKAAATAQTVASGAKSISTRAGTFTIDGSTVGNEIDVVILGYTLENSFYTDGYDPDNPSVPVCFAFGDDAKTMAPIEEDVQELQHPTCKGCPMNEFGSADTGRGKACKNQAKLLLISDTDLDDMEAAEPRTLKVPVTSVKNLTGYIKNLNEKFKRPPLAVVTKITLKPDPKTQFQMHFSHEGDIDGEVIGEIIEKADANIGDITKPYEPISEDQKPQARGRGNAKKAKVAESAPSRGVAARRGAQQPAQAKRAGRGR